MPWNVSEGHGDCPGDSPFAVVKTSDGSVAGCHPTRQAAVEQLRALYAAEERAGAAEDLSAASSVAFEEALLEEPALVSVYAREFRSAGRIASESFSRNAVTAAATPEAQPEWVSPPTNLLVPVGAGAQAAASARAAHRRAARRIVEALGLEADLEAMLTEELVAAFASRFDRQLGDVVARTTLEGFTNGWSVERTAYAIQVRTGEIAPATARMLARTDLVGLANAASLTSARRVLPEAAVKRWLTAGDAKVRPEHVAAHGQEVPVGQPFAVGGSSLMYPGDPSAPDGLVINCRCTQVYASAPTLSLVSAAVDHSTGVMIALYPRPEEAEALAQPEGQAADDLHVTLAFFPDGLDEQDGGGILARLASLFEPLSGAVGGVGRFGEGEDGSPVIALASVVGLNELRAALAAELDLIDASYARDYGFVPHVTLAYGPADTELPDGVLGLPLTFDAITFKRGQQRHDFPLGAALEAALYWETEKFAVSLEGAPHPWYATASPEAEQDGAALNELARLFGSAFGSALGQNLPVAPVTDLAPLVEAVGGLGGSLVAASPEPASVIVNVPEQPAPIVNVTVPEPIVTVNVPEQPPPVIVLPEQPAPVVNVIVPDPPARVIEFERDVFGRISGAEVVDA